MLTIRLVTCLCLLLFGAIPCTGGSTWTIVNLARCGPSTRRKIYKHRRTAYQLWRNFEEVAERCISNGGLIAFEWPRGCMYWHWRRVKAFIERHKLIQCNFDGCQYGLPSINPSTLGKPIMKPWRICTNMSSLQPLLSARCKREHKHVTCQGMDTKPSEDYTPAIAEAIHNAWRQHTNTL